VANLVRRFLRDEAGVAYLEYGLIASLIAVGTIGWLTSLAQTIKGVLDQILQVFVMINS